MSTFRYMIVDYIKTIDDKILQAIIDENLFIRNMPGKSIRQTYTYIQKLRNDFAHGNMDIDIDSDGLIGIIYLERLIYIMQLKRLGLMMIK